MEQGLQCGVSSRPNALPPALSAYLDLVRFSAAVLVLMSHAAPELLGVTPEVVPGHDAVVVFFVLSGFVIGYVTDGRETRAGAYAVARLSRLWSVCVPALLVTAVISCFMTTSLAHVTRPVLANLLFLGEWWTGTTGLQINPPFWSLNYEAWFYLIWGVWWFTPPGSRGWWTALACAMAGPRVVFLLPLWLVGVAVYYWRPFLSRFVSVSLVLASLAGWALILGFGLRLAAQTWLRGATHGYSYLLGPGTAALTDYPFAILTAMQFVGIRSLVARWSVPRRAARAVVAAASVTFAVYLFHWPAIVVVRDLGGMTGWGAVALVGAACVLAGVVTERSRPAWRHGLTRLVGRAGGTALRSS